MLVQSLKRILLILACFFAGIYLILITVLYFKQEQFIFPATTVAQDYKFDYAGNFEELNIPVGDETYINGLLFKADTTKGLIFYLHGNGGCLSSWGNIADTYTKLGYDIFIPDYRGYGKSGGTIESEEQFFEDMIKLTKGFWRGTTKIRLS